MDFKRYLDKSAKQLDREIERILKEQLNEGKKVDQKLAPLLKAFIKSCQGGKRIRGTLVKLGYEFSRSKIKDQRSKIDNKEIIKIAAAYEILHSAILAHDDVIDISSTRRDKPSLYQALGGNHYGVSQTISLGDWAFFLSFKIISEANFPPELRIKALKLFSQVIMDTGWGEILDLEKTNPLVVMKLKTACYTISGPLQIGGILAGADEKLIKAFGKFGENLGIAYQIRDDILDAEIKNMGGVESVGREAEKYVKQAMKILPNITKESKMGKLLEQMGEYLIRREK